MQNAHALHRPGRPPALAEPPARMAGRSKVDEIAYEHAYVYVHGRNTSRKSRSNGLKQMNICTYIHVRII